MANILGKIVADFSTSLATKVAIGGTSATLQSATDDDGVALPTGTYFLTVDGNSSLKEYWQCTLTGTALTSIRNITRQGTQASGSVREHRIGASVKITNFAHLKYINDLLSGDATIDADLVFDGNDLTGINSIAGLATPTSGETTKAANVDYVNDVALAGAPDAADAVKGIVEIATQAEVDAGDDSGSTTAPVVVKPSTLAVAVQNQTYLYGESGGIAAVMTFTPVPAITALAAGQKHSIKMTTVCPGACTLATSGLAAKNVKKYVAGAIADVEANDWVIGSIADFEYDGTQYILMNPSASTMTTATQTEAGTFFGAVNGAALQVNAVSFGGTGADGALDTSGGTVNIDCGASNLVIKNYTTINVATNNLTFSNPASTGTTVILRSQGNVTITATIDASGMGAAGGTSLGAGTTAAGILDDLNHRGATGENVGVGAAAGGVIYSNLFLYTNARNRLLRGGVFIAPGSGGGSGSSDNGGFDARGGGGGGSYFSAGGAGGAGGNGAAAASFGAGGGGGGGSSTGSGTGGNGGRGGGAVLIECGGALNFTGTLNCSGLVGAAGANNASGGGGGGAAGMGVMIYRTLTSAAGTISTAGGDGGAVTSTAIVGGAGGASGGGSVLEIVEHTIT